MALTDVEISQHPATDDRRYVAWSPSLELFGLGDTESSAVADLYGDIREFHDRLVELGAERVSPRLWAMLPALRAALDVRD